MQQRRISGEMLNDLARIMVSVGEEGAKGYKGMRMVKSAAIPYIILNRNIRVSKTFKMQMQFGEIHSMRKILSIVFLVGIGCPSFGEESGAVIPSVTEFAVVDDSLPDREIDLFQELLLIAQKVDPSVDVQKNLNILDALAERIKSKIAHTKKGSKIVDAMAEILFQEEIFCAANLSQNGIDNICIDRLLSEKKGDCLFLTLLYLGLGKRLGLPFYGVMVYNPYHTLVYYNDKKEAFFVEAVCKGIRRSEVWYTTEPYNEQPYIVMSNREFRSVLYTELANYVFGLNQIQAAIPIYELALKYDPQNAVPYSYLCAMYSILNQIEPAIQYGRKSVEYQPNFSLAQYHLGNALQIARQYDESIQSFQEAVRIEPKMATAYNNMGISYEKTGKIEEAIASYQKALEANPNFDLSLVNLGNNLIRKNRLNEAVPYYKKYLEIRPDSFEVNQTLASALCQLKRFQEAIPYLQKTMSLKPDDAFTYHLFAYCYLNGNDYSKAWEAVYQCQNHGGSLPPDFLQVLKKQSGWEN